MVAYLFLFSVLLQTESFESSIDLFNTVSCFLTHTQNTSDWNDKYRKLEAQILRSNSVVWNVMRFTYQFFFLLKISLFYNKTACIVLGYSLRPVPRKKGFWLTGLFVLLQETMYRMRHKLFNTPLSHERLVVRTWHFVQLYPQPLYTASQVPQGLLTDLCLKGC
jgi:hypothetical protein